jgi:hypothetical protein
LIILVSNNSGLQKWIDGTRGVPWQFPETMPF